MTLPHTGARLQRVVPTTVLYYRVRIEKKKEKKPDRLWRGEIEIERERDKEIEKKSKREKEKKNEKMKKKKKGGRNST